jgi:hypothetical protein
MTDPDIASLKAANGGHWGEHPEHSLADWAHDAMEDSTRLGYWEWVDARICDQDEEQP